MILLANIFEGAGVFVAGTLLGYLLVHVRDRKARAAQSLQTQSLLENARREAEAITREARLAANEAALKLREQTEQAFAERRQERLQLEKRLSEREALINSQLEGVIQAEKNFREQKEALERKADQLDSRHRE